MQNSANISMIYKENKYDEDLSNYTALPTIDGDKKFLIKVQEQVVLLQEEERACFFIR